ncbi:MAG: PSD1 and planctomycete cytochrome C domain-containing protein [Rhodothermaceae bacterium]|nr:PSD1 and planctomycete cytochrome C domain-containing protein [Rhodothermaceae bacterium]
MLSCLILALSGCSSRHPLPDHVDFNFHVKPLLADRCFKCHGPDPNTREADLRFDTRTGAFASLDSLGERFAIVAGDPANSEMIHRINHDNLDERMPPLESNLTLSEFEKKILEKWVKQGAEWKAHWAFMPPEQQGLPSIDNEEWAETPIDHFILARLEREGLSPVPAAAREKWLRRVTFDLTGLPPTLDEIDAFLEDQEPDAYERVVDRLIASKAYGERMAVDWLDLARYADTQGHHHDFERNMWPWRDWVIQAFNDNMPYDQFVTWQLAGDLLPDPTYEQLLATGFNRNHKITQECGVIEEEFRVEYVVDRTNTFSTAFLGLTMQCAQCHDHKYDPISQKEYYQLFSFFNNVPERGRWPHSEKTSSMPSLPLPVEQIAQTKQYIDRHIRNRDSGDEPVEEDYGTYEAELNVLMYPTMVMAELDTLRPAYILNRGLYSSPGERVFPETPESILPFSSEYPRNRLGLSQWLFDPAHPLTARVTVNRYWQMLFGTGLVHTPEDFGSQGALPTHPELIDWLAVYFMESGWDVAGLLKTIVLSSTYRQSSTVNPDLLGIDPGNALLSRGPHLRLTAEMVRDQVLAISGLLVDTLGGPPVKPYQPDGLWKEVSSGGTFLRKYNQSAGDDLYRRSLYTFWKRIQPPPNMITFDAASRNECTVRRQQTSTPLQALVLLNDPQFVEAARVFGERMMVEGGASLADRIAYGFRWATSRMPDEEEIGLLTALFEEERDGFAMNPDQADALLTVGEYAAESSHDPVEWAAYTTVASTLLNLSEAIYK